jgi:hypothetical protein
VGIPVQQAFPSAPQQLHYLSCYHVPQHPVLAHADPAHRA